MIYLLVICILFYLIINALLGKCWLFPFMMVGLETRHHGPVPMLKNVKEEWIKSIFKLSFLIML